jgi:RNA polymerase sigma-70 factor, ECF subfamily
LRQDRLASSGQSHPGDRRGQRRARRDAAHSDEDPEMIVDPVSVADDRQIAAASLRTFMRLPVAQRSSVILMDVLGYSLQEIGGVMDSSVPAIKAALHRGRASLRALAQEPDDHPLPVLAEPERSLLTAYVDRFNARDFDTIRNMLADEVRLDLVARVQRNGRGEVESYFTNYGAVTDWHLVPGLVDGRPAALVCDPHDPARMPAYFILLAWADDRLLTIRDFRFARYRSTARISSSSVDPRKIGPAIVRTQARRLDREAWPTTMRVSEKADRFG